jgi:hypothetical protein
MRLAGHWVSQRRHRLCGALRFCCFVMRRVHAAAEPVARLDRSTAHRTAAGPGRHISSRKLMHVGFGDIACSNGAFNLDRKIIRPLLLRRPQELHRGHSRWVSKHGCERESKPDCALISGRRSAKIPPLAKATWPISVALNQIDARCDVLSALCDAGANDGPDQRHEARPRRHVQGSKQGLQQQGRTPWRSRAADLQDEPTGSNDTIPNATAPDEIRTPETSA